MALSELTCQEILQAMQEYDRLGREAFLEKYGFGQARSYLLVHDGKTYDSKAIAGAAHGFLPGRSALSAADFSGGDATVGRLLANLGFEVRTDAGTTLTTNQLLDKIAKLRPLPVPRRTHRCLSADHTPVGDRPGTARAAAEGIVDIDTARTEPTHSLSDTADTPLALSPGGAVPRGPVGLRRTAAGTGRPPQRPDQPRPGHRTRNGHQAPPATPTGQEPARVAQQVSGHTAIPPTRGRNTDTSPKTTPLFISGSKLRPRSPTKRAP
jgi:hypothetical protein